MKTSNRFPINFPIVVSSRARGHCVTVFATWAINNRWAALERKFLAEVVHARLANSVKWLLDAAAILQVKHERSKIWLGKLVLSALRRTFLKISYLLREITYRVFCRTFRVNARRQFLLQAKTNRLDVDQYPCETLLNLGDLVIVPAGNSGFCEVNSCPNARECGHDVHKSSPGVGKGGVRTPDSTFGGDTLGGEGE